MSSRPLLKPFVVLAAGDMTLPLTSAPTTIQQLSMGSYQCNWNGAAPVGSVSLQTSNDYSLYPDGSVQNPGNWVTVPLSYNGATVMVVPITGNTGSGIIDIDEIGTFAIRLIFTPTSGTGTLQIIINAKVA